MSLCDKLEAGLMHSQTDNERLMEAVVGRIGGGGLNNPHLENLCILK